MENEGQLPSSLTSSTLKLNYGGRASGIQESGSPNLDNVYASGSRVQSPIGDDFDFHYVAHSGPPSTIARRRKSYHDPDAAAASSSDEYETDSETDSDETRADTARPPPPPDGISTKIKRQWDKIPAVPLLYRNIFKCALAYLLGSLFTFVPFLSGLIADVKGGPERRPSPSGHMVATVAVYYNPAKTLGGMMEADLYCTFGLAYASLICLTGMAMFRWLEDLASEGRILDGNSWIGDIVAVLWIGLSMATISWLKVYMPSSHAIFSACSMTCIILFVVIIKEGGLETLLQVAFIIFSGSIISNLVCFIVWPVTAASNLQTNMTKTLDSFSTLLTMLTHTFLLEPLPGEGHKGWVRPEKIQRAVDAHQSSFTSLKKALSERKSERTFVIGKSARELSSAYEDAVASLNRLAQHLNGLRGGTRLQYDITRAGLNLQEGRQHEIDSEEEDEEIAMLKAAASMFGDLVDDLGPPLKSLSTTCTDSLRRLRESFMQSHRHIRPTHRRRDSFHQQEFAELAEDIEKALGRFESTSNHAVLRLYRRSDISMTTAPTLESLNNKDNVVLTGADNTINEHVFLVYFFIFTLQEFANELTLLVDAMERIYTLEQQRLYRPAWWKRWLNVRSWLTAWRTRETERPATYYNERKQTRRQPTFPKVRPHAPNTVLTPSTRSLTFWGRVKQRTWALGVRLAQRDTMYAFKVGMGAGILAAPAFFDRTRPAFLAWYGDWALISYFVVMSPTIGGTNYLGFQRIAGTIFGAAVAMGVYTLFSGHPTLLAFFGFLFSLPCFWFTVAKPKYVQASRFVLLTYNLTCLYWQVRSIIWGYSLLMSYDSYNTRARHPSVVDVGMHRAMAVTGGVIWAGVISRLWWPSEARRELSHALGEFCLNLGWLYTRLVASNSFSPQRRPEEEDGHVDETTSLLKPTHRLNSSVQDFMAMELHLQIKLIELQGLLAQTQHEPRLKGPFPVLMYRGILTSLQVILDRLHSMRCVTTREECVRKDFIIPVNKERREMVGNIILAFSILAASFRLKAPLPPFLPPAEKARQRLVDAIRKLDVVKNRDVKGSRQLLFFAYALTMKGVTEELDTLGHTLQEAFGVIGQSPAEFEALFVAPEEGRGDQELL
ncbi:Fusaric acid resistance protein-like-domain-containing protein [Schizophyllum fasciatum]